MKKEPSNTIVVFDWNFRANTLNLAQEGLPLLIKIWMLEKEVHCVKSVRIRSYSSPYLPAFGLNTERYGVFSPNAGKYGPE